MSIDRDAVRKSANAITAQIEGEFSLHNAGSRNDAKEAILLAYTQLFGAAQVGLLLGGNIYAGFESFSSERQAADFNGFASFGTMKEEQ